MKTVLLVEDNDNDVFMMRLACEEAGIPHLFKVARDGDAAVEYLSGTEPLADGPPQPPPDVVFLDIKMPKRDGHQVLKWIRAQHGLQHLPVIMLTGSDQMADVTQAYELGATSYLQKVPDVEEFGLAVRIVLRYWLEFHIHPSA